MTKLINFVSDQGNSATDKGNFVTELVNSVPNQGNFVSNKLKVVTNKGLVVPNQGNFDAELIKFEPDQIKSPLNSSHLRSLCPICEQE